jgi:hypothetical protein
MSVAPVPPLRARPAPPLAWAPAGRGHLALRGRPKLALVPHLPALGCHRLVTLLSAREGAPTIGRAARETGLAWTWSPLDNGRPPVGAAARALARTAAEVAARLADGERVMIHCAAGLHRTGMLAYGALRLLGLPPDGARRIIGEARPETLAALGEHHVTWGEDLVAPDG